MKIMYDAVSPSSIPDSVPPPDYAMGYIDGRWPSFNGMKARFPSAIPVSISAIPGSAIALSAFGCDGEQFDYTPAEAAQFARDRLTMNFVPFIYCSLSEWDSYIQAVTTLHINPWQVDWIIAAYPGNGANLYPGAIGHQYVDRGTYDESVIQDGWIPGRSTLPPKPKEKDMDITSYTSNAPSGEQQHIAIVDTNGSVIHWYYDPGLQKWSVERLPPAP